LAYVCVALQHMAKPDPIDTSGNANPIAQNPFARLEPGAFPAAGERGSANEKEDTAGPATIPKTSKRGQPNRQRGRVDVIRQTAGRGGKTVTVLTGFKGIAERELHELARTIQRACGTGGTVKGAAIEIQGDQRDRACAALEAAGFQPVRAGG
jgi:translation initiation factor 1